MSKKISIMYAEDHNLMREACVTILSLFDNIEVIGQAENGVEMLNLMQIQQPDILITDIDMPEMDGIKLSKEVNEKYPSVKIILLSMHYTPSFAAEMISSGTNAFLPKNVNFDEFSEAIYKVHNEGYYTNPTIDRYLISNIITDRRFLLSRNNLGLSDREKEILKHLCEGKSNKEIAESLFLSTATVDFHRQSIYKKTEISSVALLVKYAIKNGITSLD